MRSSAKFEKAKRARYKRAMRNPLRCDTFRWALSPRVGCFRWARLEQAAALCTTG